MLLRLCARRIVGRRSSWATSANSSLATVCSVTCDRSPAFSGSVLTERKHASNLFATRWQRCAGLILLRSGVGGLPFGFSAPMLLPVFLCARRTPGLVRYYWLGAGPAYPQLFRLLAPLFLLVAAVLFALSPLTSVLFVFPPVLPVLLKFEWGWGAGWLLACVWFYGSGFGFWGLRLPCRPAGQRNGALEINSFGIP